MSRVSVAFFAVSGLDVLESLQEIEGSRDHIINWIYSLQVQPNDTGQRRINVMIFDMLL